MDWGPLSTWFAKAWFDLATLAVAIGYAIYRRGRYPNQKFVSKQTGIDIAHGIALFPLFLLAISIGWAPALSVVEHSHKIILSVAGIVALLAILEDR